MLVIILTDARANFAANEDSCAPASARYAAAWRHFICHQSDRNVHPIL